MAWKLRRKINLYSISFNFAVAVVIGAGIFLVSNNLFFKFFQREELSLVSALARSIDGDLHSTFSRPESIHNREYRRYLDYFVSTLQQKKGFTYLYTLQYNTNTDKFYYIIDGIILNQDTVWIETEDFAFQLSAGNHRIESIVYNQVSYTNSFNIHYKNMDYTVIISNTGIPSVYLDNKVIISVSNFAPFAAVVSNMKISPENRSIEVPIIIGSESLKIAYTFTASNESESYPGDEYNDTPAVISNLKKIIQNNQDTIDKDFKSDIYGKSMSCYGMIRGRDGKPVGLVAADIYQNEILDFQRTLLFIGLLFACITFILSFHFSSILSNFILKPLKKLYDGFQEINKGNLDYKVQINRTDEFGELAGSFNEMTISMSKYIDEIKLVAKVFENSSEGIVITDHMMQILQINAAYTSITGYEISDVLLKKTHKYSAGWNEDSIYEQIWENILEHKIWQGEFPEKRKYGTACTLHETVIPIWNENGFVTNYIIIVQDITEKKKGEEQIRLLAYYDQLTNLPNRTLLNDRLDQALAQSSRFKTSFAVVFLDLDNFKKVNDSLGHHAGDALLKTVANYFQNSLRKYDTCSRLAGDEFIMILPNINGTEDVEIVAKRILKKLSEPIKIQDQEFFIGCSIGISLYPADADNIPELMKKADMAMYYVKQNGKSNFQFYQSKINSENHKKLNIESHLHNALKNSELFLFFQPQKNLAGGKISGVEALIRWQHPNLGLIPPSDFIPVAEESDLILLLGEWVLYEACKKSLQWHDQGFPPLTIAVNISEIQLRQKNFVELIKKVIKETGINPERLEIEITEGLFMTDIEENIKKLHALRNLGIRLAIDDFGTGYSSMAYLQKLPVNRLKIDRAFIKNIPHNQDDMVITNTIITLAHSLNISVIAEGVETREQLEFLEQNGCEEIQGYYYSQPLSEADLAKFI